jgi:hypothetical protein
MSCFSGSFASLPGVRCDRKVTQVLQSFSDSERSYHGADQSIFRSTGTACRKFTSTDRKEYLILNAGIQCFGSESVWIRIQLVAWIRLRNSNADPNPGGLKEP